MPTAQHRQTRQATFGGFGLLDRTRFHTCVRARAAHERIIPHEKLESDIDFRLSETVLRLFGSNFVRINMATVRIRDKHQITLPAAVMQAAAIARDDVLNVEYINGVITLTPTARIAKRVKARDFLGALQGTWGKTAAAIDKQLRKERDTWDR